MSKEDEMSKEAVQRFFAERVKGFNKREIIPLDMLE